MSPSFRFVGGKSRLRNWLVSHFPPSGDLYLEPFAGRGNVFFKAYESLKFNKWHLNDLDASFLKSLTKVDLSQLPQQVNRDDFAVWKNKNDDIAKVIEPRVTFAGKGYKAGYSGTSGNHKGYNRDLYCKTCQSAKDLLSNVKVTQLSWENLNIQEIGKNDFVYCDPPYFNTEGPYPNINHTKLISVLNSAGCRWAISGYVGELYDSKLNYKNKYTQERNSEVKGYNARQRQPVVEVLWTNY